MRNSYSAYFSLLALTLVAHSILSQTAPTSKTRLLAICTDGQYSISGYCYSCSSGCKTCSSSSICSVCFDGYYRSSSRCYTCGSYCKTCSGKGSCSECMPGYKLYSSSSAYCVLITPEIEKNKVNKYGIIGIVILSVAALMLISFIIYCCRRGKTTPSTSIRFSPLAQPNGNNVPVTTFSLMSQRPPQQALFQPGQAYPSNQDFSNLPPGFTS